MSAGAQPRPDPYLGFGYEAAQLSLADDSAGACRAVLLHRVPPRPDAIPVLVVHGWSDYVLDRDLLEHLAAWGFDVWGIDLRRHGPALRPGERATRVDDLRRYDEELEAALARIGAHRPPLLLAHSMGGLVAAQYAQRRPEAVRALALNAPWLEMHGGRLARRVLARPLALRGRILRGRTLLRRGPDHYARSAHRSFGGAFDYDLRLKPAGGHPLPAETLAAVIAGQRRLEEAGPLIMPVLVLTSERSAFGLRFRPAMRRADTVLDVRAIRAAARRLGPQVRLAAIPGARHDVFLSDADARAAALRELRGWCERVVLQRPTIGAARAGGGAGGPRRGRGRDRGSDG